MPEHDHFKPKVFGMPGKGLVGIVARNPIDDETTSVRFDPKYTHQLALDLLDMAEVVEDKRD